MARLPTRIARIALALLAIAGSSACNDQESPAAPSPLPCTFAIAPASRSFDTAGGSGTFGVTTRADCAWQAATDSDWIAITSGAAGAGDGTVAFAVSANTAESNRSGAIKVADQSFAISQAGRAPCTFEVSPQTLVYEAAGGAGTIAVSAGANCAWSATSAVSWMAITGGTPGEGNGVVAFTVAAQATTTDRTGTLSVAGKLISVTQRGAEPPPPPVPCEYTVAPTELSLHWHGTPTDGADIAITAPANCVWTATSGAEWLQVLSGAASRGSGALRFRVDAYLDQPTRRAPLQVRWPTPTEGQNVWVTQEGCYYAVTATTMAFSSAGGPGSVMVFGDPVSVNCMVGCPWTAVSQASWIRVVSSMPRAGDDLMNFVVDPNTTGVERVGIIRIGPLTLTIRQAP